MITWVLTIIILTSNGSAVTSTVYHSPIACKQAAKSVEQTRPYFDGKLTAFCTEDANIN